MIRSLTLSRYFARQYALWFIAFMAGLTGIIFLFEVAELTRRAANIPALGFGLILRMGFYKLPDTVERVLPFVILFAGMFTFWRLTRSQELIVARTAGVSAWQFMAPALAVTLAFSFVNVTVLNPLGTTFNAHYKKLEMHYFDRSPVPELTGAGLWLRQQSEDGRRFLLHADRVALNPLTLSPLLAFIYDEDNAYAGRIDAPKAVLHDGYWDIRDAWLNMDQQPQKHMDAYKLPTTLTLGKIQESMAPPNTISFWELPGFIRAMKAVGLPPVRHEIEFQRLLSQPMLLCAMVFFAAAFSLRMYRRGSILGIIAASVALGNAVFVLNDVVKAMGANQVLPVFLAAWGIPAVALALGNAALLYLEDG